MAEKKIKVTKDGPYLVSGEVPLAEEKVIHDEEGMPLKWEKDEKFSDKKEYALCRCGKSKNKPYCDGSHKAGFDGEETADNLPFAENAEEIVGAELTLEDNENFCIGAAFCERAQGVWESTANSQDPKLKQIAVEEACNCPSGRLVLKDKHGKVIEPDFAESISTIEDTEADISGPLWAKGGIEIESADGTKYEKRNRVILCRCGRSGNKPFCNGTHKAIGFDSKK